MATKLGGFRVLGGVGFAALAVTLVSACGGGSPANTAGAAHGSGSGLASGFSAVTRAPAPTSVAATPAGTDAATPPAAGAAGAPTHAAAAGARAKTASVGTCLPASLKFTLGSSRQLAQSQWEQAVVMTNHTSATCTMKGFPGVDVIGDASNQPSYDWTLTHSSASSTKVTLRPGAAAHFDVVYLSGDLASGGGNENVISVQRMVITTPGQPDLGDNTVQGSLAWFQSVVLQDGATHPGTYATPVVSGS